MQRMLDRAGLRRRDQFRPRQIDFQEIVGHLEPTAFVAVEQMMAAGNPEVVHLRSRPARPTRSTVSAGCSSSPSTSRKENARAGFCPARGRSVRKVSRTSPLSKERCTATSVSRGWLHSDSAKATSSSAAATASATVGRAEMRGQMFRQCVDDGQPVGVVRFDDLHQRRPAERSNTEKAAAERRARLAFQCRRVAVPEGKGARHRPLARLGRLLEHESVRGIEADGAQQFHVRGPFVAGSNQDGAASFGKNFLRSISALPARRISRSPLSSMSRRRPFSIGSRSR